MIFLVEEETENGLTPKLAKQWDDAGYTRKTKKMGEDVFQALAEGDQEAYEWFTEDKALREAIYKNLSEFGADPGKNPFIRLFRAYYDQRANFQDKSKLAAKIRELTSMHNDGEVFPLKAVSAMKERDYGHLLHPELYTRTSDDFHYTVKLYRTLNDPQLVRKYFKDPKIIDMNQLLTSGGEIKPAGDPYDPPGTDTLTAIVNKWAAEGEPAKESGSYTLLDVLKDRGVVLGDSIAKNAADIYSDINPLLTHADDQTAFWFLCDIVRNGEKLKNPDQFKIPAVRDPSQLSSALPAGSLRRVEHASTSVDDYMNTDAPPALFYKLAGNDGWRKVDSTRIKKVVQGCYKLLNRFMRFKDFEEIDPDDKVFSAKVVEIFDNLDITKDTQQYLRMVRDMPKPTVPTPIRTPVRKKSRK